MPQRSRTQERPPRLDRRGFLGLGLGAALAAGVPAWARGEAAPSRRILYISGRLSGHSPGLIRSTIAGLGPSPFNVAILAFLYARWRGGQLHLTYNGTPFSRLHPELPAALRRLRQGFPVRKKLLLSLGGWGNRGTFDAIRSAGVAAFLRQLDREVIAPLGLDGLDLDLEPGTKAENTPAGWHAVHDDLGATLVAITNGYMERHPDHFVTHAPIASVAAALYARDGQVRGIAGSLFDATRTPRGNNIAWLNLQFYEAGDPKPISIPDYYRRELLLPLLARRAATNLARPWQVLVPGFEPRYHQDLAVCQQTLRALNRQIAPWGAAGGAFLWQYGQIAHHVSAWGKGLQEALA